MYDLINAIQNERDLWAGLVDVAAANQDDEEYRKALPEWKGLLRRLDKLIEQARSAEDYRSRMNYM